MISTNQTRAFQNYISTRKLICDYIMVMKSSDTSMGPILATGIKSRKK